MFGSLTIESYEVKSFKGIVIKYNIFEIVLMKILTHLKDILYAFDEGKEEENEKFVLLVFLLFFLLCTTFDVMDCHVTARGSIPGRNGVSIELHVLRKEQ